jgi:cyclic pyranopterin phosphate synthase
MQATTLAMIIDGSHHKGDVRHRIAGIQAAKHLGADPAVSSADAQQSGSQLQAQPEHNRVRIESLCRLTGKTGVEMEALTAASVPR